MRRSTALRFCVLGLAALCVVSVVEAASPSKTFWPASWSAACTGPQASAAANAQQHQRRFTVTDLARDAGRLSRVLQAQVLGELG
jgi:hypothetical protein